MNKILLALSVMLSSAEGDYSYVSGTYQTLHVQPLATREHVLIFKFSEMDYFNDLEDNTRKCKVLTVYLTKFDDQKWNNPMLRYFDYSQFESEMDAQVRKNTQYLNDRVYKDVILERGIHKIRDCYYLSDAAKSEIYNQDTRSFTFGYKPIQSEAFFWWNHGH